MKTLLIATEPYATSMLLAERQLLMSFAYVAPADRQAIVPLVPGGFGYPAELRMGDNLSPLNAAELAERNRLACQPEPSVRGAEVTPVALEVQRQLVMRFGYAMSPTLMATVKYDPSGASGWPAANVLSVPYSTCGKDDRLVSQSVVPHPSLGVFGDDAWGGSVGVTSSGLLHRLGMVFELGKTGWLLRRCNGGHSHGGASVETVATQGGHPDSSGLSH
jgi:hypothetical protein